MTRHGISIIIKPSDPLCADIGRLFLGISSGSIEIHMSAAGYQEIRVWSPWQEDRVGEWERWANSAAFIVVKLGIVCGRLTENSNIQILNCPVCGEALTKEQIEQGQCEKGHKFFTTRMLILS